MNQNIEMLMLCCDIIGLEKDYDYTVTDDTLTMDYKSSKIRKSLQWSRLADNQVMAIELSRLITQSRKNEIAVYNSNLLCETEVATKLSSYISKNGRFIKQTNGCTYYIRLRNSSFETLSVYQDLLKEIEYFKEIKVQKNKDVFSYYIDLNPKILLTKGVKLDYMSIKF